MMVAAVRVASLMHRVPPKEYSIALIAYFGRNGWTPEEVERAADGIETDSELLHMISLDGGLTPRPFLAWRESVRGKADAKLYTHREACDEIARLGTGARLDTIFAKIETDSGIRFRRTA